MAVAGLVRLRKHQFGAQTAIDTPEAATAAYPFKGVPTVDLGWTDPDVDSGSIDPVAPPYRGPGDYTAALTDPALAYNSLPLLMCATWGGGVTATGGGTAKTWTHAPASATVDEPDLFTYEFGDDVVGDWFQLGGGIIETLEITGPDQGGALTTSMSWRFASAASTGSTDSPVTGSVPTAALNVDLNAVIVYLKDCTLHISSTFAGIGAGVISDALHSFVLRITKTVDQKRYANGTQSFDVSAWAVGARSIELELLFAKTSDTVGTGSEADAWFSDDAVTRFVQLVFESPVMAETVTPYSWTVTMPMRYYTRADEEIGGNSVVRLVGHALFEDTDFDGPLTSAAVTTRGTL